jgi:hypothetical protein
MSFEKPQSPLESKIERQKTLKELKGEMQAAMILLNCHMDDYDCHEEWLQKNADNFHFAFDNIQAKYGDMFELWENDRSAAMDHMLGELKNLEDTSRERKAA